MSREEILGKISTLIKQNISDKQIIEQLLELIDDYGIESYSEGHDEATDPRFY